MQNKHFNIDIKMAGKRIKALFMSTVLLIGTFSMLLLTGCSSDTGYDDDRISIVCTTFPQYDWLSQIIGDNSDKFRLTLLINGGVDLHSYQPSAKDMTKISSADVFVYVGGESDAWVLDAVRETKNNDMIKVNMMELISDRTKEEEVIEGMQESRFQFRHTHTHSHSADDHSDDHADEHSDDHTADDNADEYTAGDHSGDHSEDNHADDHSLEAGHSHTDEDIEYDEHIWLSLKNAETFCNYITDKLSEIDAENAEIYKQNNHSYVEKLSALDEKYQREISSSKRDVLLFADRFPFRYMTDDYSLTCYAAFPGCSAETQASFETITFLAGKINELGLTSVITIDGSDSKIANTVINETQPKHLNILTLDIENGFTYLSVMENNLENINTALN